MKLLSDAQLLKTVLNVGSGYPKMIKEFLVMNGCIPHGLQNFRNKLFVGKNVLGIRPSNVPVIDESGFEIHGDSNSSMEVHGHIRPFGLYMQVLVELDLEMKGFTFFVELEYENFPEYSSFCNHIGHCLRNFKRKISENGNEREKPKKPDRKVCVQVSNRDIESMSAGISDEKEVVITNDVAPT
ncbi:hypothetical protein KIW84_050449 [Lathyrus oleraceus]|uniref:Uncharacterized protein n=1 Tax=Pisum sativum TaxID=3888 RepID=A0A9D4WHF8_PEA|nr:hypothetical protein KIW84_050449 [Pisum sativum]